jgi:hypothetical protein
MVLDSIPTTSTNVEYNVEMNYYKNQSPVDRDETNPET